MPVKEKACRREKEMVREADSVSKATDSSQSPVLQPCSEVGHSLHKDAFHNDLTRVSCEASRVSGLHGPAILRHNADSQSQRFASLPHQDSSNDDWVDDDIDKTRFTPSEYAMRQFFKDRIEQLSPGNLSDSSLPQSTRSHSLERNIASTLSPQQNPFPPTATRRIANRSGAPFTAPTRPLSLLSQEIKSTSGLTSPHDHVGLIPHVTHMPSDERELPRFINIHVAPPALKTAQPALRTLLPGLAPTFKIASAPPDTEEDVKLEDDPNELEDYIESDDARLEEEIAEEMSAPSVSHLGSGTLAGTKRAAANEGGEEASHKKSCQEAEGEDDDKMLFRQGPRVR